MFCSVLEFGEEKRTFAKVEEGNVDFFLVWAIILQMQMGRYALKWAGQNGSYWAWCQSGNRRG